MWAMWWPRWIVSHFSGKLKLREALDRETELIKKMMYWYLFWLTRINWNGSFLSHNVWLFIFVDHISPHCLGAVLFYIRHFIEVI